MTCIELYDIVDEYMASKITSQLAQAQYDEVSLKIHSIGGSVFDGNLIFNKIKEHGRVTGIVEGICASMASIILQSCKERKMTDNGMLMIHAPSTYTMGTAKMLETDIKILKDIEQMFKSLLMSRCKMTEEQANNLMDGNDHWYTAQEAKEAGIIDEIVPAVNALHLNKEKLQAMSGEALRKYIAEITPKKQESKKEPKDMITEKTKQQVLALGINQVDLTNTEAVVATLVEQVNKEREARKTIEDAKAKETEATIATMVDKAIADKKITAAQKELFAGIGKTSGISALQTVLDTMSIPQSIHAAVANISSNSEDRRNWDFEKWQKEDPKGLEKMNKENSDQFESLYNKHVENQQ